jgi:hypothetical protein
MPPTLRAIGLILFLGVAAGCGKPNPQNPALPPPDAKPNPYPPPPDAGAIPGEVRPGDVEVTEDGAVIFSNNRASYISGYQDGWRECCNLHMRGKLDLNDERTEPMTVEHVPDNFNQARKDGFKACQKVLRQRTTP